MLAVGRDKAEFFKIQAIAVEIGLQGAAGQVFHHQVSEVADAVVVVDLDDIRVIETRQHLALAQKQLLGITIGQRRGLQHLDRRFAPIALVLAQPDLGHRAFAELAEQRVVGDFEGKAIP